MYLPSMLVRAFLIGVGGCSLPEIFTAIFSQYTELGERPTKVYEVIRLLAGIFVKLVQTLELSAANLNYCRNK